MKNLHTDRLNFALTPRLKKSIEIAAHARMQTVSEYIRSLVIEDIMNNSELFDREDGKPGHPDAYYVAKHKLP